MILLTVGSVFPFDRLVRAIDELALGGRMPADVFGQIGDAAYAPRGIEWCRMLDVDDYGARMAACAAVIGHAGSGTIVSALRLRKPTLVLARRKEHGEAVDDHQLETARRFAEAGLLLACERESDLADAVWELSGFAPRLPETSGSSHPAASIEKCLRGWEAGLETGPDW